MVAWGGGTDSRSPLSILRGMADVRRASENFARLAGALPVVLERLIQKDKALVEDYITDQLYSGVDGNEQDLSPDYLHDPYFKQYGKRADRVARGYMAWKMRITPPIRSWLGLDPRKPNVPNLYINGYYHSRIRATEKEGGLSITGTASFSSEIEAKYGSDIYKVSPTARKHFLDEKIKPFLCMALNPRGYELRM